MPTDAIEAVGIDQDGRLWIKPKSALFPYIYREAIDVNWDEQTRQLLSPKPKEWSYIDWFKQIKGAGRLQGVELFIGRETVWSNIDDDLRHNISGISGAAGPATSTKT